MRADKGETSELDAILQQSIHEPRVAQPFWTHVATEDENRNWGLVDFILEASSKGRHVVEYRESAISWNMRRLGAKICFFNSGALTSIMGYDNDGCEWQVYEDKCLAAGDPCCRFIVSSAPTEQLDDYLDSAHSAGCEDVFNELIRTIADVGLKGVAPPGRRKLGSETHLNYFQEATSVPALSNEKFMLAMRLAGANVGTKLAEKYMEVDVKEAKARMALSTLFATLKIGRLSVSETVKLYENCESYGIRINEPICFFTTGFLNSFFRTTEGLNVKEIRCAGAGDQICEWEFS
jgi:predicted hydrocarbon binding protein